MFNLNEEFKQFAKSEEYPTGNFDDDNEKWKGHTGEALKSLFRDLSQELENHPFAIIFWKIGPREFKSIDEVHDFFHNLREDYIFTKGLIDEYFTQTFKAIDWFKERTFKDDIGGGR